MVVDKIGMLRHLLLAVFKCILYKCYYIINVFQVSLLKVMAQCIGQQK